MNIGNIFCSNKFSKFGISNLEKFISQFSVAGITNGAEWYNVAGGMQDYNYLYGNTLEITVEMACCKYPYASTLKHYWNDHKYSLLKYMSMVHMGVKGFVK